MWSLHCAIPSDQYLLSLQWKEQKWTGVSVCVPYIMLLWDRKTVAIKSLILADGISENEWIENGTLTLPSRCSRRIVELKLMIRTCEVGTAALYTKTSGTHINFIICIS